MLHSKFEASLDYTRLKTAKRRSLTVRVLPHWPLPPRARLTLCMKAWVPFLAVDKPRAVPVKEKKQLTRILASPSLGCNE